MITRAAGSVFGFLLPAACNAGLAGWLAWHALRAPAHARGMSFRAFAWFYAVGGLAIVLSCAAAFLLLASDQPLASDPHGRRLWLTAALINITLPSLLMLALIALR